MNKHLYMMINLVNFDYSAEYSNDEIKECISFMVDWGSKYLNYFKLSTCTDGIMLNRIIGLQTKELFCRQTQFKDILSKVEHVKEACEYMKKKYAPELVWIDYMHSHPELYRIAMCLLSICPSESSVERSFSMQDTVHRPDRNRLDDSQVEAEMIIKMHYNS
jgi:hypothetical protein